MKIKYTIGEMAELYHISTDTLRYYEQEELLVPQRAKNGYRVYTIFDTWKLNVITTMKRLGVSLKDIKHFLDDRSIKREKELLSEESLFIDDQIQSLTKQLEHIHQRLHVLDDATDDSLLNAVRYLDYSKRKVIFIESHMTTDDQVDMAFSHLANQKNGQWSIYNRDFATILPLENIKKAEYTHYSHGILIVSDDEQLYDGVISEGRYATIRYRGQYTQAAKIYQRLRQQINADGYRPVSDAIERYMIDVNHTSNADEYVTEIQIRVEREEKER
ncbi:MerR family transcriptional regulator [Aerococcaceae bacterium DSM 111020]|nr:MerR family transcriptional regulator [Aerococcaceae bacterium DSM 111020]